MTIARYNHELLPSFNNVFEHLFNDLNGNKESKSFVPDVDIAETDKAFEVQLAVPGMKKEDFKIELNEGKLTISGKREVNEKENKRDFHTREIRQGSFSRSFYMPDLISEEGIKASYEAGLLTVLIPKTAKPASKQIEIK